MLIRTTCSLVPGFHLLTFGDTCLYILHSEQETVLFDCGLAVHLLRLKERISALEESIKKIDTLLLTSLDPARVGGLPFLRKMFPELRVYGSSLMQHKLQEPAFQNALYTTHQELCSKFPTLSDQVAGSFEEYTALLTIDRTISQTQSLAVGKLALRVIPSPGHTEESLGYLILPHNILVADQTYGYFRGKDVTTPGADYSLDKSLESVLHLKDIELFALCFPYQGTVTGSLIQKHLKSVQQNSADVVKEVAEAKAQELELSDVQNSIRSALYVTDSTDPIFRHALLRSFTTLWTQITKPTEAETTPGI